VSSYTQQIRLARRRLPAGDDQPGRRVRRPLDDQRQSPPAVCPAYEESTPFSLRASRIACGDVLVVEELLRFLCGDAGPPEVLDAGLGDEQFMDRIHLC
jgi:hypothetical protein